VARINIDRAIADALADRGHHPHPHAKAGHLNAEALLGMYPMLEAWRQRF
jgi:hypothetical protein